MTVNSYTHNLKQRLKSNPAWWARSLRGFVSSWRYASFPYIAFLHKPLWFIHHLIANSVRNWAQQLYFTPMFKSRLSNPPRTLQLYSGIPQVGMGLQLNIGESCRISGVSSFFGRAASAQPPECSIGCNVDIGWQTTIAVGRKVQIGDHVRIAGRCYLAGFPGHPESPHARSKGMPETESQVGDIVLKDHVWLASGVTVIAGVTIGENSIIAAGSVVTKDLPANVVAGGVPAKVLRSIRLNEEDS